MGATQELGDEVGGDLTRLLETPIVLAMSRAGFTRFLEQKLVAHGPLASLRALVEQQHECLALAPAPPAA
jgi:hypothetical protein